MEARLSVSAVIVAAGSSARMGFDKLTAPISGVPAAVRSVLAFERAPEIDEIVLVAAPGRVDEFAALIGSFDGDITKLSAIVPGGATRQKSALAGVLACRKAADYVCIHDAARPLVSQETIRAVVRAALLYGAATAAVPVKDTIKTGRDGFVESTPDRSALFAVQTPQAFQKELYLSAVQRAGDDYSDDCQLIENIWGDVFLAEGNYQNIKLTTPDDFAAAEAFLRMEAAK